MKFPKISKNKASVSKGTKKRSFLRRLLRFSFRFMLFFFISTIATTILYRWVNPPATPLMVIRLIQQKASGQELKMKYDWVDLDSISPYMPQAVVAGEDGNFMKHNGFDWEAIGQAREYNKTHAIKRGASTISQQTAKNVFLWPDRTWVRKGLEVYFTFLIELFWSKERIMEVYLNVIEMGDGIYGVEKASQVYFKKPAKKLTMSEAATISASLPNPRKWNPRTGAPQLYTRKGIILRNMYNFGPVKFD